MSQKTNIEIGIAKDAYIVLKKEVNQLAKRILEGNWGAWQNQKQKLFTLADDNGLIEAVVAIGDGDDGFGYYKASIILNIKNFRNKDFEDLIYLVIQYVPEVDADPIIPWETKEFHENEYFEFRKIFVLLEYMKQFDSYRMLKFEIHRLAERKYSTCVHSEDQGGISFY